MGGRELPAGNVTVLFTDIEDSTRLIDKLGEDGYMRALNEHRSLLRAAFSAHDGVEVDTQGDAFLYAFADPVEALAAATHGQEALACGEVKVRMGLHTGQLQLTGEGYAGRELHRAARIAASGHGGQTVISAATRALVDGELTELGEHRLKGFDEPVALFQLGSERFPPLRTISNTNLPRSASSFVGRARERDELVALLTNGSRLVTLAGPGGSGKTRLALEVASELVPTFKAGVFWVGLSALRNPALVTQTIAQTLGARNGLAEQISERELLLLLDNFEQVIEAAPELSQLLEACPNLKLLVTSRELLRINGEVGYPVPPLAEPEAVELFCQRSRLDPDETIAELCRGLDDLPLAVELAAARTRVLTPGEILDRLGRRLDLLKGGRDADPRQQTLRATIEWSHDLLSGDEQQLFARLAVFRGGCTLEAAEDLCATNVDLLQSLVDKSLVRHTNGRFWMLETIRAYAAERLHDHEKAGRISERHARWYLGLAKSAYGDFREPATSGLRGPDAAKSLARLGAELENLRGAIEWARAHDERVEVDLVAATRYFLLVRGFLHEALGYLRHALVSARSASLDQAELVYGAAVAANLMGDYNAAQQWLEQLLKLGRADGDAWLIAEALVWQGHVARGRGDRERARALYLEAADAAREGGNTMVLIGVAHHLAEIALETRDLQAARKHYQEELELARGLPNPRSEAIALLSLSQVALAQGDIGDAVPDLKSALQLANTLGDRVTILDCLVGTAEVAARRGARARAARLLASADVLRGQTGAALYPHDRYQLTRLATAIGDDATLVAARTEGLALTLDEAVDYALEEPTE